MNERQEPNPTDIAVIGMAGRVPGARNLNEFWRNLRDGVESITFLSDEQLSLAGVDPETMKSPGYVRASGMIDDVELFDAAFFKFSPREAEVLDPQQRIFMECAWEGLEHAGYDPERYKGLIGVYAGTAMSDYLFQLYSNPELEMLMGSFQLGLGNDKDNLTTIVSYKLNLKGPSMAIQTACSTSLVAVYVACHSLLNYECDIAIAGGVKVQLPQGAGYFYQEGGIMSPDGHCRAFDDAARGTIGGSGVGVVVLKRLSDALTDRDCIHAVIKGGAVNNDGAVKVGYTAPSVEGQAQVIATAQAMAGIDPSTITFVEAHGTGTDLGDPIEVAALTQAFRLGTSDSQFCALGSVKTNIGHLDTASGVAGLLKAILALKHKAIPPSLNFARPNARIDFANSPFYINTELRDWKTNGAPRRAGVNCFGIGGTNAHVIVEEAPVSEPSVSSRSEQLLVLSAKTESSLEKATANLLNHLRSEPDVALNDVAYTLQVGRQKFNHARVLVCANKEEAIDALAALDSRSVVTGSQENVAPSVAFMFPGQGAQHVQMARGLYRDEPTFRAQIDLCSELLQPLVGHDLREVLFPSEGKTDEMAAKLRQTCLAQPALFVIEYALAALLMDWGLRPVAMIGHSLGEYVAACLAGVFSLEDALRLVAERGRMMQQMPAGAMLSVALSEQETRILLNEKLSIAAINSPSLTVVSGEIDAVGQLEQTLAARGVEGVRRLATSHAFHSEMMDPILEPFTALVAGMQLHPPKLPYISNRTGNLVTAEEATNPLYWASHLRETVRFSEGLDSLLAQNRAILLEVGPGQTLGSLAKRRPAAADRLVLSLMRHAEDQQSDDKVLLRALGRVWLAGFPVNWDGFHKHDKCQRTPLPTYPFDRRRFWIAPGDGSGYAEAPADVELSKRPNLTDWFYVPAWKRTAAPNLYAQRSLEAPADTRWLVFADECGIAQGLVERLKLSERKVVIVSAGQRFAKHDERSYEIDFRRREDYHALFEELRAAETLPNRIVHLLNVTSQADFQPDQQAFAESQLRGFYSLIYIAQELAELPDLGQVRIAVVSNHLQTVNGDEDVAPLKATLLGPCLVISEEYPNIKCQSVDLILPESDERKSTIIDQLLGELEVETTDRIVAYRGAHRWAQSFESVRLEQASAQVPRLKQNGVYLITGGLGGIGFTLAEHLAKTVQARLILVGRSSFPERTEWERLRAHGNGDNTSSKVQRLCALEEAGAELLVVSADVSNLEAMKGVVAQAIARFGKIDGVIHAAGVAGSRIIQLQTPEVATQVLAPKVLGTLVLDEICQDLNLDFFVLCSSLSSICGAAGQTDYCGANAFLDAFSQAAFSRGKRNVVSVNWDTWQEVGMAVNTVVPKDMEAMRAESLKLGILRAEGVEALNRILNTALPQVAVSTTDLIAFLAPPKREVESAADPGAAGDEWAQPLHTRPVLGNEYVAPRDETEQTIASLWQELLGVEKVGVHDNFFELGGHSLLAIQFISRFRGSFQTELALRNLFESPTVAELATRLKETKSGKEPDRLEDVLAMVEKLSEDEVRALLAKTGT
jgi:acyl transferase domain-containing protein/acyl carrier protein